MKLCLPYFSIVSKHVLLICYNDFSYLFGIYCPLKNALENIGDKVVVFGRLFYNLVLAVEEHGHCYLSVDVFVFYSLYLQRNQIILV